MHEHLIKTKSETHIVPGKFRCFGSSGLRVEVLGDARSGCKMLIGAKDNSPIYVDKDAAIALRDFFADLVKYI